MFIDSHAHLTSEDVFSHIDGILERAQTQKIDRIVNICTGPASLEKGLALAKRVPWVYNTAATTPHDVEKEGELFFPMVVKNVKNLVAIGETGLDYYYEHSNRELQKKFLKKYFELAIESNLPLIFHCRDAFSDLFALADENYKHKPAVLHCFTGTLEEAKAVFERGWYLSFSGIVTFKKSESLREVVKYAPLDRILIETDTPYLAPQSKRGKPNEPSFLPETAALIASIKNRDVKDIGLLTSKNAENFFSF